MGLTLDQTSVVGRVAVQLLMFVHHLLCIQTEGEKEARRCCLIGIIS